MDRFIAPLHLLQLEQHLSLKSNMDRFIGSQYKDENGHIHGFKIQYG